MFNSLIGGNRVPNVGPGTRAFNVTPDNNNDLEHVTRAVVLNVAGVLKVTTADGDTVTTPTLNAGQFHPMSVRRIWSEGTTATGIQAWW